MGAGVSDLFVERLFAGIPEEIEKLHPFIAEVEAFNARVAASEAATVAEVETTSPSMRS